MSDSNSSKFLKVDDCIYKSYIKSIHCDETKCTITIANTEVTAGGYYGSSSKDGEVHCFKKYDCYNKLKLFVDKL